MIADMWQTSGFQQKKRLILKNDENAGPISGPLDVSANSNADTIDNTEQTVKHVSHAGKVPGKVISTGMSCGIRDSASWVAVEDVYTINIST